MDDEIDHKLRDKKKKKKTSEKKKKKKDWLGKLIIYKTVR